MELSRFFTLPEMTKSDTAVREGIPNQPDEAAIVHLRALCNKVLDPLREAIGQAIKVNSGYRGPALNRRIGGAAKSQHVAGKAADIQAQGMPVLELFKTIIRNGLPFDQLIYEAKSATAKWVHVSHNPGGNRGQIMVAEFGPDGRPRAYPQITARAALEMVEPTPRAGIGAPELEYIEMADEPLELPEVAPAAAPEKPAARRARAGKKAPARRAPARKAPAQKAPRRKAGKPITPRTSSTAAARKGAPKKGVLKKGAAKKGFAGKAAPRKGTSLKAVSRKTTSGKAAARKATSRKTAS
jgi:hypothetical protein